MSLVHLRCEVRGVGEELLEVDNGLIEEHTGDSWGVSVSEGHLDDTVDVVSDEVALVLTRELIEGDHVSLRQLKERLILCGCSLRSLS